VAEVVKPGENDTNLDFIQRGKKDKNVMPYEMENFVNNYTEFAALTRIGGEIEMVKRLIANGFPVLIEKGYYEADYRGIVDWLGHYLFITGYDESQGYFIVQDAYLKTGDNGTGANLRSSYEDFADQWRSFNYLFMVIYPPDRQDDVLAALGPWAETEWANRHALETAQRESEMLSGINQFFAWYNLGSSHVSRFEYVDAANAYDYAFQLYAALDEETVKRPFRMIWYQTGPYFAYFYSGRYQDVIDLANRALYDWSSEPTLEESIYWRGMALLALGETDNAVADFQQSVYLNPNFNPGWAKLAELGFSQ
jgi:tetratricopeptide (TPR) repeat protein